MEMHGTAWNQRGILVPRPYREGGKKLKVTRPGMNKWNDLCEHSRDDEDHIILTSKHIKGSSYGGRRQRVLRIWDKFTG